LVASLALLALVALVASVASVALLALLVLVASVALVVSAVLLASLALSAVCSRSLKSVLLIARLAHPPFSLKRLLISRMLPPSTLPSISPASRVRELVSPTRRSRPLRSTSGRLLTQRKNQNGD